MTEMIVDLSRIALLLASAIAVGIYASRGRWVAIWHGLTCLGLAGFLFIGWEHFASPAFSLSANAGTTGVILWVMLFRRV